MAPRPLAKDQPLQLQVPQLDPRGSEESHSEGVAGKDEMAMVHGSYDRDELRIQRMRIQQQ